MRLIIAALVLATVSVSTPLANDTESVPGAIAVISKAEIDKTAVTNIQSLLSTIPTVQSYRYGDNPRGTPTLTRDDAPAATPDVIGAMVIQPGTTGFTDLTSVVQGASALYGINGDGLLDSKDYAFFLASRSVSELEATSGPVASGLALQIDFPIGFADRTGWVANSQFPGDTWQGASLVLSGQLALDGTFQSSLIDTANGFSPVPFDGMFAIGADWAIAAVDLPTLTSVSDAPVKWGFASHVHDGSFGSCASCPSVVTAYPEVPRTNLDLFTLPDVPVVLDKPAPEAPASSTQPGEFPLWLTVLFLAVLAMIVVALIGWFVMTRPSGTSNCSRLRRAWENAKRRLATTRELLESQTEAFNSRMARVGEVEALLAEYRRALDGPTASTGGNEFARLDGELILVDGLRELIAHLESDLTDARTDADRERVELDNRLATFNRCEEDEAAARAAYEACVAASAKDATGGAADAGGSGEADSGPATPPATPSGSAASGPRAPAVVATPPISSVPQADCGCNPEASKSPVAVPVGPAQPFRLYRDFDVISRVDEASQHGADTVGAEMATGLKDAGTVLNAIGSVLGGASAGKGAAKAVGSFQTGQIVKGSLEGVKGTVEGLGAANVIPNVPTSLPEAVAQGLAATANLGAFVADKVTEWMGKNTLVNVHVTFFYQTVSIQPTQIWVCEDGAWRCATKVNVYTVGPLERERGREQKFTVKSDPERRRLRAHLATLASRGRLRITNSVSQIAAWEAAHPTGGCP